MLNLLNLNSKKILSRYLYLLLIDLRNTANESGDKRIFELTNLFHNLPLQMSKDEVDCDKLLKELMDNAKENKGLSNWLENNKK